ncbi:hypothetical protein L9F63_003690, partial [Diploptera punctata]
NMKLPQNGIEYATTNYNCCMGNNNCSRRLPRISTDAETTKRIVEAFDASLKKINPPSCTIA